MFGGASAENTKGKRKRTRSVEDIADDIQKLLNRGDSNKENEYVEEDEEDEEEEEEEEEEEWDESDESE